MIEVEQHQTHARALVVGLVEGGQSGLERRVLHRQAVAVAGMEVGQRVPRRQRRRERGLGQGPGVAGARQVLGLQHLALAQLRVDRQLRRAEHVHEPRQAGLQARGRQLEEEVGVAGLGAGVEAPAAGLDEGHEPLLVGVMHATEEQQVFEKMRKPGPFAWLVMAAGGHPQRRRRPLRAGHVAQQHGEAVVEEQGTAGGVGNGRHPGTMESFAQHPQDRPSRQWFFRSAEPPPID